MEQQLEEQIQNEYVQVVYYINHVNMIKCCYSLSAQQYYQRTKQFENEFDLLSCCRVIDLKPFVCAVIW